LSQTCTLDSGFCDLRPFAEQIKELFNKESHTIHNARNILKVFNVNGKKIVVKSFKVPNVVNQIVYSFFRDSKAARSYMYSQKLKKLSIATPQPIAFVEYRRFGLFQQSYYLCEHFDYDFEIRAVLKDPDFTDREQIFKEFAHFSYGLHEAGVYHVDYSPGNVLIKKEGAHFLFSIVDVNRMEFMTFTNDLRMKNLSRFSASEHDTQMIAKFYAEAAGLDKEWALKTLRFYHEKHQEYMKRKRELKRLKKQK
jgi:tRNA A-37 threonylcarbamoyl transferase component Bud32